MTYQLFIGANNTTKRLEVKKIEKILSNNHEGFTILPATGYWQGQREKSCAVIVSDTASKLRATINILKQELDQEAIAWHRIPELQFS